MYGRVLLDDLLDTFKSRRKRRASRRTRMLAGLTFATRMVGLLVPRQQALAPLYQALGTLLQPSDGSHETVRLLQQLRRLKGKLLDATTDDEATTLHQQIDALRDVLTGDE